MSVITPETSATLVRPPVVRLAENKTPAPELLAAVTVFCRRRVSFVPVPVAAASMEYPVPALVIERGMAALEAPEAVIFKMLPVEVALLKESVSDKIFPVVMDVEPKLKPV